MQAEVVGKGKLLVELAVVQTNEVVHRNELLTLKPVVGFGELEAWDSLRVSDRFYHWKVHVVDAIQARLRV